MSIIPYDRSAAAAYAARWAFGRNPRYLSFDGIGGDCTNFISQCLYAGCGVMNDTRDVGWYYNSPTDRSAGWSGVPYLYRFLINNRIGAGPFAVEVEQNDLELGDIIQLGDGTGRWYHSLLVTQPGQDPLVSTHTFDAHLRPLSSYLYGEARRLHIQGARR